MQKKIGLGLSLALVTLSFLSLPAMGASPPQAVGALSTADQAFIASLAIPGAPTPAARPPQSGEKALCSAQANCWDGSVIGCLGNNSTTSCSATDSNCAAGQRGSVTCDGNTTWCPACPPRDCGPDFCSFQHEDDCAASCSPCTSTFTCNFTFCFERCKCNFSTCPV
jgi:hypothetical protein